MQNSPDLLTSALQNPTLLEAELGRRRARDGTDGDVLAWIEATFGVCIPAVACCDGHVAPAQAFCDALFAPNSCTACGPPGRSPGRGWRAHPRSPRPPWPGAT